MLDFRKFEILTADVVKRDNLHRPTKFYVDRLNRYRDIAIFGFQDGGRLRFWFLKSSNFSES